MSQKEWGQIKEYTFSLQIVPIDLNKRYIYILIKYGNFVLDIQNFETKLPIYFNEYKKQLVIEEKSYLSKFKPNFANSCHNMGTICKENVYFSICPHSF